ALSAQRGFARSVSPHAEFDHREILLTCAQFAALHTLTRLAAYDPNEADRLAVQIMNAWEDGGVGERLWEHGKALHLDPEEIGRLADAEARLEREQTGPGDAERAANAEAVCVTLTDVIADLRAALSSLTDRAEAGDVITEDEAGEYRKLTVAGQAGETSAARADRLQQACITLGKVVSQQADTMYTARIELRQNVPAKAMDWILHSIPTVWDGDPGTEWDGSESAQAWWDRTDAARCFNDDQPVRIVSRPGEPINTVIGVLLPCPTSADVICAVPTPDSEDICGAKLDGGPCKAHDEVKATPETAPERERTEPTGM
ncbi:MAG TPA: hypothetical protein VGG54_22485, partial [Trebonia sp.]